MALLDGLRVVKSAIHGYGVITTRPFLAGELVCFGDGVLYPEHADFDDTYALILGPEDTGGAGVVFWDLVDQTRWFNHACDPNTEVLAKYEQARGVRAWWVALRDIAPGEEITYDYGFAAEVAEPCACGAASCRGVIVEDDAGEIAKLAEPMRHLLRIKRAS
jgi:hypothetical protein